MQKFVSNNLIIIYLPPMLGYATSRIEALMIGGCDHTTVLHACRTMGQSTQRTLTMGHRERCIVAIQWLAENLAREALRELLRSFFR